MFINQFLKSQLSNVWKTNQINTCLVQFMGLSPFSGYTPKFSSIFFSLFISIHFFFLSLNNHLNQKCCQTLQILHITHSSQIKKTTTIHSDIFLDASQDPLLFACCNNIRHSEYGVLSKTWI